MSRNRRLARTLLLTPAAVTTYTVHMIMVPSQEGGSRERCADKEEQSPESVCIVRSIRVYLPARLDPDEGFFHVTVFTNNASPMTNCDQANTYMNGFSVS